MTKSLNPDKFKRVMVKQKAAVEHSIDNANEERGVLLLLTGDGKGKTTSAFGMIFRALGYEQKVGVVQFIKGTQQSGEEILLANNYPEVEFHQMGTGFTWDTQNHAADTLAAERTWAFAEKMLKNPDFDLILLDELTYMIAFKNLDEEKIITALQNRPVQQSVIVTGRGGGAALREISDTVSEVKSIKHAFEAGIKARLGVDY
ncbi:cob(I)yrinic acid a,c-diamide adenosyltransferase [Gammaproteobacteria bacterium]|nr:cob(I)yrinic acid a,c-diamide adenosyltransferase [Gammaproteobacteria bacterium]